VAAAAGAATIGLDVSPRAVEVAGGLGLTAFSGEEFERAVSGIDSVAEEGFDLVVVTAGAEAAYRQAGQLVRKGGRIVCVGYAITSDFVLATPRLVLDEIEIVGSRFITSGEMAQAAELVRLGLVKPVVDVVRPLEEVNEALDDLANGRIVGRTVLRVAAG
jgi:propanol-preferring alcohol dehydrogenase